MHGVAQAFGRTRAIVVTKSVSFKKNPIVLNLELHSKRVKIKKNPTRRCSTFCLNGPTSSPLLHLRPVGTAMHRLTGMVGSGPGRSGLTSRSWVSNPNLQLHPLLLPLIHARHLRFRTGHQLHRTLLHTFLRIRTLLHIHRAPSALHTSSSTTFDSSPPNSS